MDQANPHKVLHRNARKKGKEHKPTRKGKPRGKNAELTHPKNTYHQKEGETTKKN